MGGFLIVLGLAGACMNWIILRHQKRFGRGEVKRNISMVPLYGLGLPLGCLFFPALRIHTLWVWLLDPILACLTLEITLWMWKKLSRSSS